MRGNALLQRAQNQLDGQRVLKLSTDHVEISERWVNGAGSLHTLLVSSVRLVGGIKLVASIRGVHVGIGNVVLLALGVGVLQCCGGGSGVAGRRCRDGEQEGGAREGKRGSAIEHAIERARAIERAIEHGDKLSPKILLFCTLCGQNQ
jgi:hypothetical protein